MHTYYPGEYSRACDRCGFHSDTLSNILNGCPESRNAIQSRHNRIMNIIAKEAKDANQNMSITVDSLVKPDMFMTEERTFTGIQHNRPDICVIDHASKTCMLAEVAIPFDVFVNDCYQSKFDRYLPLCQRIDDIGYKCKIIVLIIGSVGNIHKRFVPGLQMLGLSRQNARSVAKYCSVSATIGSRIIWRQRCRAVLP